MCSRISTRSQKRRRAVNRRCTLHATRSKSRPLQLRTSCSAPTKSPDRLVRRLPERSSKKSLPCRARSSRSSWSRGRSRTGTMTPSLSLTYSAESAVAAKNRNPAEFIRRNGCATVSLHLSLYLSLSTCLPLSFSVLSQCTASANIQRTWSVGRVGDAADGLHQLLDFPAHPLWQMQVICTSLTKCVCMRQEVGTG